MKIAVNLPILPHQDFNEGQADQKKALLKRALEIVNVEQANWVTGLDLESKGTMLYKKTMTILKKKRCKERKFGKILVNAGRQQVLSAYLNGQEIFQVQGRPTFMSVWNLPLEFVFDQDIVNWDQDNVLTFRVGGDKMVPLEERKAS